MAKGLGEVKKGNMVALLGFTGMNLGEYKVTAADKTEISIETKKGTLTFSRKTGVQTNVEKGKERFANKICLPEDAPEKIDRNAAKKAEPKKEDKKAKKDEKPAKKAVKKPEPEPEDEDDDDDEDDDRPDFSEMTVAELIEYAEENDIDLSELSKKDLKKADKIIPVIEAALDDDDDDDDDYEEVE